MAIVGAGGVVDAVVGEATVSAVTSVLGVEGGVSDVVDVILGNALVGIVAVVVVVISDDVVIDVAVDDALQ